MKYSVEIKQKAIEYYLVGYSAQKISTIIGVNEATIRKWLKENNINIRNGGSNNLVNNILAELDKSNLRVFNTHSKNVYYFLGGKKFSRELFEYMYENATLYLKRKYDRMKYICNN